MILKHISFITSATLFLSPLLIIGAHDPSTDAQRLFPKSVPGKIADYCAQSWIIERYSDWISNKHYFLRHKIPVASEKFQQLGLKAQKAVGVKEERIVPIKHDSKSDGYSTDTTNIYINENSAACRYAFLNSDAYSNVNTSLHHEAVHRKYNDPISTSFIMRTTLCLSLSLTPWLVKKTINPKRFLKITYPLTSFATLNAGYSLTIKHRNYFERRADIEGYYATQCHTCVSQDAELTRESISYHRSNILYWQNLSTDPNRFLLTPEECLAEAKKCQESLTQRAIYLPAEEIDLIAAHLKKKNKICDYHRAAAIEQTQSVQESL